MKTTNDKVVTTTRTLYVANVEGVFIIESTSVTKTGVICEMEKLLGLSPDQYDIVVVHS